MAAQGTAFHYIAVFPRLYEAPRPAWPEEIIARFRGIPGVVDAIFPDLTASWVRAGDRALEPNVETRRRFIEVYTKAASPYAAKATRDELVRLLDELKASVNAQAYTLVTIPIDDVEVR